VGGGPGILVGVHGSCPVHRGGPWRPPGLPEVHPGTGMDLYCDPPPAASRLRFLLLPLPVMPPVTLPDELIDPRARGRILLFVLDGLGGLPHPTHGRTELEAASTPNLDALARESSLGRHVPVGPGITPGSGPAHLALFGYDPTKHVIGRGALSALGVGFDLEEGDVAVRLNLATLDAEGRVLDRRAGRPSDDEAGGVVERLKEGIHLRDDGVRFQLLPEKEHRVVLVLRGEGLGGAVRDTDPQAEGILPRLPEALEPGSARTASVMEDFLDQARAVLVGEPSMNGVLARGFARFDGFPSLLERFGLRGGAFARYPMYRGVARLVGMEVPGVPRSDEEAVALVEAHARAFDLVFLHYKAPDARGEDGDFDAKVAAIEAADAWIPRLRALEPAALVVTGDHSTPALLRSHSWHPVPLLLNSRWSRPSSDRFHEGSCRTGDLGTVEARHILTLALAHAGRLAKFGA
jgi:2,3-bisphosphoglycerate-independent phosphoglycerate mutase